MPIDIHNSPDIVVEIQSVTKKLVINDNNLITHVTSPGEPKVFIVHDKGNQGSPGPRGASAGGLFYQVSDTPITYATTSSIKLYDISSSIVPFTSSIYTTTFNLGSETRPWKKVYTTNDGIFFVNANTGAYTTLYGGDGYIGVGQSRLSRRGAEITGSVRLQSSASADILGMYSGSALKLKINKDGIMVFSSIHPLPASVVGGLAFSGSNFYFGL